MMRSVIRIVLLGALLNAPALVFAQSSFTMSSPESPDDSVPQIIDGIGVIEPNAWPATAVFMGLGQKPCTATIIGPQVVLTAAHCVQNKSTGELKLRNKPAITVTCTHHKNKNVIEYDIATCVSDVKIQLPRTGDGYERIGIDPKIPKLHDKIQLLGFGCTQQGSPIFGVLYAGFATVEFAPRPTKPRIEARGGAVACAGDSGGAAYIELGNGKRAIIGVNSEADDTTTYLAALTDPDTLALLLKETKTKDSNGNWEGARICGIDNTLDSCR